MCNSRFFFRQREGWGGVKDPRYNFLLTGWGGIHYLNQVILKCEFNKFKCVPSLPHSRLAPCYLPEAAAMDPAATPAAVNPAPAKTAGAAKTAATPVPTAATVFPDTSVSWKKNGKYKHKVTWKLKFPSKRFSKRSKNWYVTIELCFKLQQNVEFTLKFYVYYPIERNPG